MELIRGLHNLRSRHHGCVLAIGNFDGVHRGHQRVLRQLRRAAEQTGQAAMLMIFEPQPREYFTPTSAPPRISRLREKWLRLRQQPLDRVLCVRFCPAFLQLPPETFIDQVLVKALGVRVVVVGEDFRFGHHGAGDVTLLQRAGARQGFRVEPCERFDHYGQRVSSSWVRQALTEGDLSLAEQLLGYPYVLCGRVVHGQRLGRTLGFPTANIPVPPPHPPLNGVFAVRLHGVGVTALPGVANLGYRPTINGTELRLEVHVFDFDADIYGHHVTVEFVQRIRAEQRFASLDELRAQISADSRAARIRFGLREANG